MMTVAELVKLLLAQPQHAAILVEQDGEQEWGIISAVHTDPDTEDPEWPTRPLTRIIFNWQLEPDTSDGL